MEEEKERVLIVDDSKFARRKTKELLEELGHEVIGEAVDGLDGIEKCKELTPSLILSDIEMPNLDGISMIKEIRSYNNEIKIIVASSVVNAQIIQSVVRVKATALKKPIKPQALINAIKLLSR